jgi:hypothetical protein
VDGSGALGASLMDDGSSVEIGAISVTGEPLKAWTVRSVINGVPTAEVSLDSANPDLRLLALNERLVVLAGEGAVFVGDVVRTEAEGGVLTLHCSTEPRLETTRGGVSVRAHHTQTMRLTFGDIVAMLPEEDDENELCPAATRAVDWDVVVEELEAAPDFLSFVEVVETHVVGTVPASPAEQRLPTEILQRVRVELERAGLDNVPAASVLRADYAKALLDIHAFTWRFRMRPDEHTVCVPVRDLVVPGTSVRVGCVNFLDRRLGTAADEQIRAETADHLRADWDLDGVAQTTVRARDLWTAKQLGLARIREALAALVFAYGYAPWLQKLSEGTYSAIPFARVTGARPTVSSSVFVRNEQSQEYWLGPITGFPDACNLVEVEELRSGLLGQVTTGDSENELLRHVRRSLQWRYRASLAETAIDRFLYTWIALEMLMQGPREKTSALVRRLPFTIASVGDKVKPLRRELEMRWIPLRDAIVHRAVEEHPEAEEGARRVHFFADCAVAYAMTRARDMQSYEDWLQHLDGLSKAARGNGKAPRDR